MSTVQEPSGRVTDGGAVRCNANASRHDGWIVSLVFGHTTQEQR